MHATRTQTEPSRSSALSTATSVREHGPGGIVRRETAGPATQAARRARTRCCGRRSSATRRRTPAGRGTRSGRERGSITNARTPSRRPSPPTNATRPPADGHARVLAGRARARGRASRRRGAHSRTSSPSPTGTVRRDVALGRDREPGDRVRVEPAERDLAALDVRVRTSKTVERALGRRRDAELAGGGDALRIGARRHRDLARPAVRLAQARTAPSSSVSTPAASPAAPGSTASIGGSPTLGRERPERRRPRPRRTAARPRRSRRRRRSRRPRARDARPAASPNGTGVTAGHRRGDDARRRRRSPHSTRSPTSTGPAPSGASARSCARGRRRRERRSARRARRRPRRRGRGGAPLRTVPPADVSSRRLRSARAASARVEVDRHEARLGARRGLGDGVHVGRDDRGDHRVAAAGDRVAVQDDRLDAARDLDRADRVRRVDDVRRVAAGAERLLALEQLELLALVAEADAVGGGRQASTRSPRTCGARRRSAGGRTGP